MRIAILIVYFFHKFERGSAQKALRRFKDALQREDEGIEAWTTRINDLEMRALRYNVDLPFHLYLRQLLHGTRPGYFLTELRKAKNPKSIGQLPQIHDRDSFDLWFSNTMANYRQTQREKEGHQELQLRDRQRNRNRDSGPRSRNSRITSRTNRQNKRTTEDLKRQGPGYRQERNPHSKLLQSRPKHDQTQPKSKETESRANAAPNTPTTHANAKTARMTLVGCAKQRF